LFDFATFSRLFSSSFSQPAAAIAFSHWCRRLSGWLLSRHGLQQQRFQPAALTPPVPQLRQLSAFATAARMPFRDVRYCHFASHVTPRRLAFALTRQSWLLADIYIFRFIFTVDIYSSLIRCWILLINIFRRYCCISFLQPPFQPSGPSSSASLRRRRHFTESPFDADAIATSAMVTAFRCAVLPTRVAGVFLQRGSSKNADSRCMMKSVSQTSYFTEYFDCRELHWPRQYEAQSHAASSFISFLAASSVFSLHDWILDGFSHFCTASFH